MIFTPNTEIKSELKATAINITCYDRNGNIVKSVTSVDDGNVEDPDDDPNGGGSTNSPSKPSDGGSGGNTGGGTPSGGSSGDGGGLADE